MQLWLFNFKHFKIYLQLRFGSGNINYPVPAQQYCKINLKYFALTFKKVNRPFLVAPHRFQMAYCNLLKSNMDGLKRQKKQKAKKAIQD
jgi:hypothetical protein